MKPRDVVLLVVGSCGGSVSGRTLLQKTCYFVDVTLGLDLGFEAHYYGPYSTIVEDAVGDLKGLGFVKEERVGLGMASQSGPGEWRRFDYSLTDDGRVLVQRLRERCQPDAARVSAAVERIRSAGSLDYRELSAAAKIHFILKRRNRPMTPSGLRNAAGRLDWELSGESIERAIDLLRRLDLVSAG